MKIFIAWSGSRSGRVAKALYDWLPIVIQNVDPYISEEMEKGTRWASEIAKQVEAANFGLCCITRDNLTAPWMHFEAGALSKVVDKSYVVPILFDVMPSDIQGPLAMFQSTTLDKEQMLRLVKTINRASADRILDEGILSRAFEGQWMQLAREIEAIREGEPEISKEASDTSNPILEEILVLVRQQTQTAASFLSDIGSMPKLMREIVKLRYDIIELKSMRDGIISFDQDSEWHTIFRDLSRGWTPFVSSWSQLVSEILKPADGLSPSTKISPVVLERTQKDFLELRQAVELVLDRYSRSVRW